MNKICKQCKEAFNISKEDLNFYEKVSPVFDGKKYSVPPPTLCPHCRQQRRLVWRNERKLYNRKCDFSGKQIISVYSPDKPYKVYEREAWWGNDWDGLSYGRDFDFSRPFFDQFQDLLLQVPRIALWTLDTVNSDYNQSAGWLKNCYLLAAANHNEDCYYGNFVNDCKDCVDNLMIKNCELCYECVECEECYDCAFSKNCKNCTSSQFLFNCIGCKDCFGCVNLQQKQYCLFNEQLSKDEYETRVHKIELHRYSSLQNIQETMKKNVLDYPVKFMIGSRNEDVTGNSIFSSKSTHDCYDVSKLENCRYCYWLHESKDCMDVFAWGMPAELCYDSMEIGSNAYHNLFTANAQSAKYSLYSNMCMSSENIFGCVGLKKKSYCILNKQYSKEEYEKLVPKIIEHMRNTRSPASAESGQFGLPSEALAQDGEWGEFFPMRLSPFDYNETVANEFFPLSKDQAMSLGANWKEEDTKNKYQGPSPKLSDAINDISDDILKSILTCMECKKNYKIIPQELQYYRRHKLALPRLCPTCRHQTRIEQRNPRKLWDRICMKCGASIRTSYAPERPEIVYCEKCYLEVVY